MSKRFDTEIVVLAAGMSQRMGDRNKLLLPVGGEPLVRRSVRMYRACADRVTVTLGHDEEAIRQALEGLDVRFAMNNDYQTGQKGSVRTGLQAASLDGDALVIGLADQPLLEASDLAALLDAFADAGGDRIMVPYYRGNRGNPVVFPAALARELRNDDRNPHCRAFIDKHPELTRQYEALNDHFTTDIDTPEDFDAFSRMAATN